MQMIHPSRLIPPSNDPRQFRDPAYIASLAADLRIRGMRHPIYVIRKGDKLEVLTGETRRLAALQAGLEAVPVIVLDRPLTEAEVLIERLLENELRSDFSPLEKARIYIDLMRLNGWSQAELASAVHVSPGEVSRTLAVSKRLPEDLQAKVASGELCPAIAYQLSRLPDPAAMRELADKAAKGLLKRDAAESQVARLLGKRAKKEKEVKVNLGGIVIVIRVHDLQKVFALLGTLDGALKKLEKHGLPLSSLPSLLKS
jgi:ParB/RepB/Spo0J family partition protein